MRYAQNADPTGGKKDGHSRGKRQCKRNRRRKRQEGAKNRFTDKQKGNLTLQCYFESSQKSYYR